MTTAEQRETKRVGEFLEQTYQRYHRPEFLGHDPLEFVHRYRDPLEQEGVAVLSAVLAYGQVRQIRASVEAALSLMTRRYGSPRRAFEAQGEGFSKNARGWVHRFNTAHDLEALMKFVGQAWEEHGSLGGAFLQGLEPDAPSISVALDSLIDRAQEPIPFLLTRPSDGSVCKRWCMFLRWMGRKDDLDLGLWTSGSILLNQGSTRGRYLSSRQLVFPLDTHTARMSKALGIITRKTLNWKSALEVTEAFRKWDSNDPLRFDFSLCRYGMFEGRT